jgi:hypothetical protein
MAENIELHWKDYLTHCGMSFGEFIAFVSPSKLSPWAKIGYNGDVDAGIEDMWTVGGEYTFLTAETQLVVVGGAEDDPEKAVGGAGTGVWSVRLYYLNKLGQEKSVDATLNGTAEVALSVSDVYRVQNLRALTTGTGKKAAGAISLKLPSGVGSTIYTQIAANHTRARNSAWTVPAGKRLYIESIAFSCGGLTKEKAAIFTTLATYDDKSLSIIPFFFPYHEVILEDESFEKELKFMPTVLPAGVDIKIRVQGLVADCITSSALRGFVETI